MTYFEIAGLIVATWAIVSLLTALLISALFRRPNARPKVRIETAQLGGRWFAFVDQSDAGMIRSGATKREAVELLEEDWRVLYGRPAEMVETGEPRCQW